MRRAWVLLEIMVALSIFTMSAMVVLSAMGQASRNLELARLEQTGLDLARSAIARLEAGLSTTADLSGPVPVWSASDTAPAGLVAFEDDLPELTGWELEIETEPSAFPGLTLVSVTAVRRDPERGVEGFATTLRQLVRMTAREQDTIGDPDALASGRVAPGGGPR